jgi:hypothetical protein
MENLNAPPAVEQSEPVSQAATAAATSVVPVASTDENAQAEAAELPQSDASAPAEALAGHRAFNEAVQFLSEDASDNGEAHEHELARMVDEGGPCPERTLQPGFYRVVDHPFQSFPTPEDPLAQRCHVEGCKLSYIGHPDTSGAESFYRALRGEAAIEDVDASKPSLQDRVEKLEAEVAQLRKITEHHGLRGPQD